MSYILDALKRADAERGHPPTTDAPLATQQHEKVRANSPGSRRTGSLVSGLIAALAALIGGGWWFYGGGSSDDRVSSRPEPAAASSATAEPATATIPDPVAPAAGETSVPPATSAPAPVAVPVLPILSPTLPSPPKPAAAKERVAPVQTKVDPPSTATRVAPAVTAAPELPSVPPTLSATDQAGVPKVQITGSSYSTNPEHRILIANGQVVKEGQEVSPGLTLEVIGPHSAVFNHRGTRYNINY